MAPKRIAVIGGGPMGICAMKSLKEENLEPVCFERTSYIGGLWRYHEDDVEGLASVMKTTVINHSKESGAFSDFPPSAGLPNFMHNRLVHNMLMDYAKAFDIERHVLFNRVVTEVNMAADYEVTGRLTVVVMDTESNEITEDTFDGVMVCIGHHVYPNVPSFPGIEKFKGKIMHTHSLKKVDEFEEQNVVVVGVGDSGVDAAVEISSVAKQVYLSTRRGAWVSSRVGPWGLPIDVIFIRRWLDLLMRCVPQNIVNWVSERILNERFDHETYSLKPTHGVWNQHPTISDALPIKLLSGAVSVRKNIREFVQSGVIFEGAETMTECHSVILATGYKIKFPFLNEKLLTVKNNQVNLYQSIFPPHLKHPSLAIMGLIQITGAGIPIGEAQTRWVSLVFGGKLALPSQEIMVSDIRKKTLKRQKKYFQSERHTIQVDYIPYLDEINSLFGAKPNLLKIFFTDPVLFCTIFFGPFLPYQYRLQGPHTWPGARKAILEWDKRVIKPLNRDYEGNSHGLKLPTLISCFILLLLSIAVALIFKLVS